MQTISDTAALMELSPVHVRTFAEVVRHASFSRAAETLHVSQPAVSHHIRHLESALGARLLERVGRRAFPTAAGEVLLEHAGRALAELEAARQAIQRLRGVVAGRVRLGTGATASTYLLPDALRRLRAQHPELELVIVTGNSADLAAAVAASQLDVAVLTLPVRGRQRAAWRACAGATSRRRPRSMRCWPRSTVWPAHDGSRGAAPLDPLADALRQPVRRGDGVRLLPVYRSRHLGPRGDVDRDRLLRRGGHRAHDHRRAAQRAGGGADADAAWLGGGAAARAPPPA